MSKNSIHLNRNLDVVEIFFELDDLKSIEYYIKQSDIELFKKECVYGETLNLCVCKLISKHLTLEFIFYVEKSSDKCIDKLSYDVSDIIMRSKELVYGMELPLYERPKEGQFRIRSYSERED